MLSNLRLFESGPLMAILFIFALAHLYLGNISLASQDLFLGTLGWILGLPILMLKLLASSSYGFLAPFGVLLVLAYIVALRQVMGDAIGLAILTSWILISLGV